MDTEKKKRENANKMYCHLLGAHGKKKKDRIKYCEVVDIVHSRFFLESTLLGNSHFKQVVWILSPLSQCFLSVLMGRELALGVQRA